MSKCLCLGMTLDEVVRATTSRPAETLGLARELGSLRPGSLADIALFELERGRFHFYDINMDVREGAERLRSTLTIAHGRRLARLSPDPPAPWLADAFVWPAFQASLIRRQREGLTGKPEG
ncbi:MAG: amidohydrolase family protein [Candidatus Rokuibacteriota bacterium]